MNVLQINTHDVTGGAARAMYRLHQGLRNRGHRSRILARSHALTDPNVFSVTDIVAGPCSSAVNLADQAGRRVEARLGVPFTRYPSTKHLLGSKLFQQAQVLHLHNLHGRYFNYHLLPLLSVRKPTVWTLHDMWALTGYCAYAYDCCRWKTGCYDCPLLKEPGRSIVEPSPTRIDCTRRVWRSKQRLYRRSMLHIVTPSLWLCRQVEESILARASSIQCIPNGVDMSIYRPLDQAMARQSLGIAPDQKVILFVAAKLTMQRKGLMYLLEALAGLHTAEGILLVTIGEGGIPEEFLEGFKRRHMGKLNDERLQALVYSAADLFVFPTLADNQPLVLIESLACGTPVVAFDVGGVPEMIRHMETGYLARYKAADDLSRGIHTLLDDKSLRIQLRNRCREVAEAEYSLERQVERYVDLYRRAVKERSFEA